ncbi:MAG: hypothetical protein ACOX8U_04950 [Bradymonadia bacterium]|jgi:hypothetical protein
MFNLTSSALFLGGEVSPYAQASRSLRLQALFVRRFGYAPNQRTNCALGRLLWVILRYPLSLGVCSPTRWVILCR